MKVQSTTPMFTNVTLIFFLLLVPLSGFIAWIGDRIGHRTGKRRHSLWGMRPRHTAMLFTIGTGIGISLLSFGLFYLSSERFRVLISEGETLVQKNHDLKDDNARQALLLKDSQARIAESRSRAEAADRERRNAETARDTARDGQKQAEQQAQTARTELKQAAANLSTAQKDLTAAKSSLTTVQGELKDKTERLTEAQTRYLAAQHRLTRAEKNVADAGKRVRTAEENARLAVEEADRVAKRADETLSDQRRILGRRLEEQKAEFETKIKEQNTLFVAQATKTADQKRELDLVTKELQSKRTELNEVAKTIETLRATTAALRGKQITYRLGEEVDRISIPAGRSVWRIQNILSAFLTTAAKKAETRGAGRLKEERAVIILPRPVSQPRPQLTHGGASVPPADDNPPIEFLSEEDSLRAVANAIRRANEDVVIVAAAATNAVTGEPVAVELKTYKNPLLFQENDKIVEGGIDGSASRQEVADALYAFLRTSLRKRLLEAGVIPPARGEDPNETAADETATVVNLNSDELLHLMEDVRHAGARARIVVRAARPLRAGDPVMLRFEVKGGNGGGVTENSRPYGAAAMR
jgi:hypothetical protein